MEDTAHEEDTHIKVLQKIDDIFDNILEAVSAGREIQIPYRTRNSKRRHDGSPVTAPASVATFPTTGDKAALRFGKSLFDFSSDPAKQLARTSTARLLRILYVARKALMSSVIITTRSVPVFFPRPELPNPGCRNIFYDDKDLFGSQDTVNAMVDNLAHTLGIGRQDLNIVSTGGASPGRGSSSLLLGCSSQGSGYGPTYRGVQENQGTARLSDTGEPLTASYRPMDADVVEPCLIPPSNIIGSVHLESAAWILVVEKEVRLIRHPVTYGQPPDP